MMRWRMLGLLFAARVGLGFHFQTMGSAGPGASAAFGMDNTALGLMIGLFMFPGLVLALPAGLLSRFGSDRVLGALGLATLVLGGVISAGAAQPAGLGFGRLVAGAGFLFCTLYITKMVADWFEGHEVSTAMSLLVTSWPLGIAMGQVGHTYLAEVYGWRVPFLVAAAYCTVAAVALWALYRPPASFTDRSPVDGMRLLPREWALMLAAGLTWGIYNAGYVVYLSFGPTLLESQGMAPLAAASVISLGSWLMIFSAVLCGQIVDRYGHRDLVLIFCMIVAAAALLLLMRPGSGLVASLLFGLFGLAPAGVIMALAGQAVAPARRSFGMGVFFTIYYAAMSLSPAVAGRLLDRSGDPAAVLIYGAVLFLLALIAAGAFRLVQGMTQRPVEP
ncbi:MAG: MFS transporter [Pseudomonadota bacterium]